MWCHEHEHGENMNRHDEIHIISYQFLGKYTWVIHLQEHVPLFLYCFLNILQYATHAYDVRLPFCWFLLIPNLDDQLVEYSVFPFFASSKIAELGKPPWSLQVHLGTVASGSAESTWIDIFKAVAQVFRHVMWILFNIFAMLVFTCHSEFIEDITSCCSWTFGGPQCHLTDW